MKLGVLILAILLLTSGCLKRRQQASLPPPPKPAAAPAPAPAPPARTQPLSIPQTDVRLPAPQPIPPEAIQAARTPPSTSASAELEAPKPPRKVGPVPPPNVKLEPEPEPEAPPAAAEPKIQALVSEDERNRLTRDITARRSEIEKILKQLPAPATTERSATVERVHSFLNLSNDAAARGDLREADAYSSRALVLARELTAER